MADDLVGQRLGRYRIEEKLGEGGMGVVFKATDEKLRRTVALKVLADDVVNDADRRRRFLREARLAASLTHPNIATVHDVGETDDGHIYIAMELVAGHSLRHRLEKGALGPNAAVRIAKDLTRALVKAHNLGIVHRDLKPDNVMVSDELEVKVLDFGLAKPVATDDAREEPGANASVVTEDGRVIGTPGYMAPEQAAGRAVDARTDVFAVGVVLYEMATGVRPFRGDSAMDVIIATARDEPARPSALAPEIGSALERVIMRCLEKNADARYADAPELMRALEELGDEEEQRSATATVAAAGEKREAAAKIRDAGAMLTQASLVGTTHANVERRAQRPRALVGVVVAGSIAVLALVGARCVRAPAPASALAAAPSASSAGPAATATAITDLPRPVSTNTVLLAEYVAGTQALRDDNWGIAQSHFMRVVELDPFLALGHLRLAMAAEGTLDESIRRENYAKAVTLRSQLSKRDEGMMEALEPVLQRLREDRAEAAKRLHLLGERYPGDVEIQVWQALLQNTTTGLAAADRAIALDPRDGQAWQSHADILATLGRVDDSRQSYERCGAVSPGSAECFLGLVWLDSMEGRCADAERDARRAVDRDPHLTSNLACVMVGAGRPIEAVREVIDQSAALFAPAPRMRWQSLIDQTRMALITGDFVTARALAEQAELSADSDVHTPFRDHLLPALILAGIAREVGDDAQAFRVAWGFVSRSDAWSKSTQGDAGIDASLTLARSSTRAGGLSQAEFIARRTAWLEDERRNIAQSGLTWTYAFAAPAETKEQAEEALAALPAYQPLSSFTYYVGIPDAEIGRTYLLAGQPDAAIPHLTKAVATCSAFRHPFAHTQAALHLGEALESKGDTTGACAAYAKVIARWGRAKPRSLSAERARARSKALACATQASVKP
ncbi:MAG: Serine/threonine protein kinase [Myxococcaceae bacterium]|nr:Serine/threonine protein kinase [Myxococcaceae bacterium]